MKSKNFINPKEDRKTDKEEQTQDGANRKQITK